MKPHNPDDLITKQTASPDDANMRLWLDALDIFLCGNSELINYVQEIVGLAAIGKVFIEAIIIAYGNGSHGRKRSGTLSRGYSEITLIRVRFPLAH